MSQKKSAIDRKAGTVVANDPGNQALQSLWTKHSNEERLNRQYGATITALVGIGPNDEIEGMIGAQLIAAHNAAVECYRRPLIGEQTFEGRRENLAQANKLSRTFATLLEALNRDRGKGQQKRSRARRRSSSGGGGRDSGGDEIRGSTPCKANCPCTAAGGVERGLGGGAGHSPAMPNGRCRQSASLGSFPDAARTRRRGDRVSKTPRVHHDAR
jgi:hypothetical protein